MLGPFRKDCFRLLAVRDFFAKNFFVEVQMVSKYFSEQRQIFLYKNIWNLKEVGQTGIPSTCILVN